MPMLLIVIVIAITLLRSSSIVIPVQLLDIRTRLHKDFYQELIAI